ncbi:uncharacterized protein [Montipora foliosa]|uniref:uncharacterized protein n=1 Tax=Montipora foliosa TaxID=591990 RepID=UPI0035F133EA
MGPDRPVPVHAAARLQRWGSYSSVLQLQLDADLMSRLPLPQVWSPESPTVNCYFLEHGDISNVTSEMIKKKTAVDPLLSRVYRYTLSGWPIMVDPERVPFKNKKDELTLEQGCLLSIWGTLVVIPTSLQKEVLKELHETHPGITKMKALARFYVLWPKIDVDFERMTKWTVYSLSKPKPVYQNDRAQAFWDVAVYADHVTVRANRIDVRIVDSTAKSVILLEMSCPWMNNREINSCEKTETYAPLRLELKRQFPGYQVKQFNIVMDVLGGYGEELESTIRSLVGVKKAKEVLLKMQRVASLNIARFFKMLT